MRWLVLLLALAACARAPVPAEVFRDQSVPIYSNASFDAATLTGTWRQVATFGAACAPGAVTFAPGRIDGALCLNGAVRDVSGPLAVTGPARLQVGGQAWWILWIDYDRRSIAIGNPSGQVGFVLDRTGAIPPDRLTAASSIFDWNGYDTTRLRPL